MRETDSTGVSRKKTTRAVPIPTSPLAMLDLTVFVIFLFISAILIWRHEPWSDETQPWLIVRDLDIPSIFKFIMHNYDGHPIFWYLLLLPLAKAGLPFFSQSILHFLIASSALGIFLWKAPFPRTFKYAWTFSYFILFEYMVITRMYALAMLLIFLIAAVFPKRFERPYLYAALIFLLFNTEFLCSGLAAGVAAEFAWQSWRRKGKTFPVGPVLIMSAGALIVFKQLFLSPSDNPIVHEYMRNPYHVINSLSRAFVPVDFDVSIEIRIVLALLIILFSVMELVRKPAALFILFSSYAVMSITFGCIHLGDVRHYGFFLISLVFALWIADDYPDPPPAAQKCIAAGLDRAIVRFEPRKKNIFLITICLLLTVRLSAYAAEMEYFQFYSGSQEIGSIINMFIEQNRMSPQTPVVAYPHSRTQSALVYLPIRRFWYADIGAFASYNTAQKVGIDERQLTQAEVVRRALLYFGSLDNVIFLFSDEINFKEAYGYRFHHTAWVSNGVWGTMNETFHFYRTERSTAG